ncbi:hypothetical protein INT43_000370 [Umbelopsis isabellina]|uniref:MMS19 nucleotide excision repair protein n=1 Tax=Mortierella isabellina TaxID=91625 RepID=A0A8H7UG33_MORIS|nr:hypothetical protein INT43_000370 [Umbelopsis isabellina]
MSSMDKHVAKYMVATGDSSTEAISASSEIVEIVNSGNTQTTLLQLIQSLGEYLTNEDGFIRAKGKTHYTTSCSFATDLLTNKLFFSATGLLSQTLANADQASINVQAVDVLVHFYCDRLSDETCVPKLLEGINALVSFDNFTDKSAMTVSKMLFDHIKAQSFPQVTRYNTFSILDTLVQRHALEMVALRAMNNEFVFGFTQVMDGEKDPRNLMKAFTLVREIVNNFDISNHVEDLFEVTFCYFPITFKPPPDDPYGITADDLKINLRHSLSSSPHFAKFAMPLLLEKLSSSSGSAKKDSMETIAECAPVYGANALLPNIDELFDALKVEIFHATDAALEDTALVAIHSVVAALSTGISNDGANDPFEKALKPLVVECMINLKDPELKNAQPAGRIMRAAASASDPASTLIIETVMPVLLRQYRETDIATQKKAVLDVLLEILEASKQLYGETSETVNTEDSDFQTPLLPYKDRLWEMFETSTTASNEYNGLRLAGIKGLKIMAIMKHYLSENEIGLAVRTFTAILASESDAELHQEALSSLLSIARIQTQQILDHTIPVLLDALPQSASDATWAAHRQTLETLVELSSIPAIFDVTGPSLVTKFQTASRQLPQDSYYAHAIIQSFYIIVKARTDKEYIAKWIKLVETLIADCVAVSTSTEGTSSILADNNLSAIASVVALVFQNLDATTQSEYINRMFDIYFKNDLSSLNIQVNSSFAPFEHSSSEAQKKTTILFNVAVSQYAKNLRLPIGSNEEFLTQLVDIALESSSSHQITALAQLHGSVVNKWTDSK